MDAAPPPTPQPAVVATPLTPLRILATVLGTIPDLALGIAFLLTWIHPARFGEDAAKSFVGLVILEFIVIHSSGFLFARAFAKTTPRKRIAAAVGLPLLYAVAALGISLGVGNLALFWGFLGLSAAKVYTYFMNRRDVQAMQQILSRWAGRAMLYLLLTFAVTLLPVPRLGITPEVVRQMRFEGSALWEKYPNKPLALGTLYFLLPAVLTLLCLIPAPRRARPAAPDGGPQAPPAV